MYYSVKGNSTHQEQASIIVKTSNIGFGITPETNDSLPNPAELFLGSLAACILKNVERFSSLMHFEYKKAEIEIISNRQEKPPKMDKINYKLTIYSNDDHLNISLLRKNIERFGTIYNTVKSTCDISGEIIQTSI